MMGQQENISPWCDFQWYQCVKYYDERATFPEDKQLLEMQQEKTERLAFLAQVEQQQVEAKDFADDLDHYDLPP
jgi:hypothetical protein